MDMFNFRITFGRMDIYDFLFFLSRAESLPYTLYIQIFFLKCTVGTVKMASKKEGRKKPKNAVFEVE